MFGNVGTTGECTLITGFQDDGNVYTATPEDTGYVDGTVYRGPSAPGSVDKVAVATRASNDARAAYNELVAKPAGGDPGAGQLGGLTLSPGVYTAANGTFDITAGDLVLDAQGDLNATWVFQSATGLTVGLNGAPRRVRLENDAQAKNVFWQVGGSVRIEDTSYMEGTIIAQTGISFSTFGQEQRTILVGRAISLDGSVTMFNTRIFSNGPP